MFDYTHEAKPQLGRRYPNGYCVLPTLVGAGPFATDTQIHVDKDGKLIDDNAVHAFTRGQCHAFALAMNQLTGFETMGIWPSMFQSEPGHVVAKAHDGRLLDITGHPVEYLKAVGWEHTIIRPVAPDVIPYLPYYTSPNVDVALPFARTLLEQEGYGQYIKG